MRAKYSLAVAAAAAFLIALIVRMPLSWATGILHRSVICSGPAGSLWNGHCEALQIRRAGTAGPLLLGDTRWHVHPARLLRGQLAVDLDIAQGANSASSLLVLGLGGSLDAFNLTAQAELDSSLVPGVPANWHGQLSIVDGYLRLRDDKLVALAGVVRAQDLIEQGATPTAYGSYEINFAPFPGSSGLPVGRLRDLAGPLQVDGTLTITPELGWQLNGNVAARDSADPELVRRLQFLGSPDAAGRRPFSAASL